MKKKIILIVIGLCIAAGFLTGCGQQAQSSDGKLKIVATIFPEYDWVMNIMGDAAENANVSMLLDNGTDLHSYQPTADDIIKISDCDLFIYVGGESDAWVEEALEKADNQDMVVVDLLDVLGDAAKTEEVQEGMEIVAELNETEPAYDEHVWLSLKNAALFITAIRDALMTVDPEHSDTYTSMAAAYLEKINALDAAYQEAVNGASLKTVLFGDRFPFRYLTEDYGLTYYAAFAGCSAESEASFETVAFLADKVDTLKLPAVLTLEGSDHKLAETIVAATKEKNAQILSMDSMQSTSSEDIAKGATYLSVMEKNLEVLTKALNK